MTTDGALGSVCRNLGIPGLVDVHTHFMPDSVMQKVWQVFDQAEQVYGTAWPIEYRVSDEARVSLLTDWGVRAFTALGYAHRPEMARWLNEWAAGFAVANPGCLASATFFPEPGAAEYVADSIEAGTLVFKVHLQVSGFDVRDPGLRDVWGILQEAGTPIVIHCGSGPIPGRFTGPGPIRDLLRSFPRLQLIVAHMGSPEYSEFLDIADAHPGVRLDTAIAFTDFMEERVPFPLRDVQRLRDAGLRGDVLFGSDFPNLPYRYEHAVSAVARLDLGDEWLREVLWGAGARAFRLAG